MPSGRTMAPLTEDPGAYLDSEAPVRQRSMVLPPKGEPWEESVEAVPARNGLAAYQRSAGRMAETVRRLQAQLSDRQSHVADLEAQLADERCRRSAAEEAAAAALAAQQEAYHHMERGRLECGGSGTESPTLYRCPSQNSRHSGPPSDWWPAGGSLESQAAPAESMLVGSSLQSVAGGSSSSSAAGAPLAQQQPAMDAWDARTVAEMEAHLQEFQQLAAKREAHIADMEAQLASLRQVGTVQAARLQELEGRGDVSRAETSQEESPLPCKVSEVYPCTLPPPVPHVPMSVPAAPAANGANTAAVVAAVAGILGAAGIPPAAPPVAIAATTPGPGSVVGDISPTFSHSLESGPSNASVAAIAAAVAEVFKAQQDALAETTRNPSPPPQPQVTLPGGTLGGVQSAPSHRRTQGLPAGLPAALPATPTLRASQTMPRLSRGSQAPVLGPAVESSSSLPRSTPGSQPKRLVAEEPGALCSPRGRSPIAGSAKLVMPQETAASGRPLIAQEVRPSHASPPAAWQSHSQPNTRSGSYVGASPPCAACEPQARMRAGSPQPASPVSTMRQPPPALSAVCSVQALPRQTGQTGHTSPRCPSPARGRLERSVSPPMRAGLGGAYNVSTARLPSPAGLTSGTWNAPAPPYEDSELRAARATVVHAPAGQLPTAWHRPKGGSSSGSSVTHAPRLSGSPAGHGHSPAAPPQRQATAMYSNQPSPARQPAFPGAPSPSPFLQLPQGFGAPQPAQHSPARRQAPLFQAPLQAQGAAAAAAQRLTPRDRPRETRRESTPAQQQTPPAKPLLHL